jgi:hypothetical protein
MKRLRPKRSEDQRTGANHQPDEADGEDRREGGLVQMPGLDQRRRHIADRRGVVAVHEQHRKADEQRLPLETRDGPLLDERGYVDLLHGRHVLPPFFVGATFFC